MISIFLFLLLVGCVSAMDGPIKVMAGSKNMVSVIIRNTDKMTMNGDRGVADGDGVFVAKTFFSLVPPYNVRVIVTDSDGSFIDFEQDVDGGFNYGMEIDCRSGNCIVSASEAPVVEEIIEVVGAVEEGVVVDEVNDSVVEVVEVVSEGIGENKSEGVLLVGKALFFEEDGSVNWIYSGGGSVILLLLLVFVVVMFQRGKSKKEVLDEDERELEEMEEKVKETEEKIKKVKEGKERRTRIYKAKLKLVEEEEELAELLESGRSSLGRVEAQRKDVEEAGDVLRKKVDDRK